MENPLDLPVPDDPIEQIHDLARDIAYTAITDGCTPHFRVIKEADQAEIVDQGLKQALEQKWHGIHSYYRIHFLVGFGYLVRSPAQDENERGTAFYDLTPKAYKRLEEPALPPNIFISYSHSESSALALLIEARLKLASRSIGIFIDKDIPLGETWPRYLEENARKSQYFVCLIGQNSLRSSYIRQEVDWAYAEDRVIIPICHNGYQFPDGNDLGQLSGEEQKAVNKLNPKQAIIVHPEGAEQYELAMIKLLNRLGYSNI